MRSNDLYLSDIVQAADSIAQFVTGMDEEQFVGNDLVRSAVLHKLAVIGEAAARTSSELRQSYPDIPWADISQHCCPCLLFRRLATRLERSVV